MKVKLSAISGPFSRPYIFKWRFLVIDDSLDSDSLRTFNIYPSKSANQDVKVIIKSKQPRSNEELKNLIVFTAVDKESGQPMLVNGKENFSPDLNNLSEGEKKPSIKERSLEISISPPRG
jgi:hypothetical protein